MHTEWEPLEADFTRYYGTDLRQAVWGPGAWGLRRLRSHIVNLPPGSAFTRSRLNAPMGWDNSTEMAATAVDSLRQLTDLFVMVNFEQSGSERSPRVVRPYEQAVVVPTVALTDLANYLED